MIRWTGPEPEPTPAEGCGFLVAFALSAAASLAGLLWLARQLIGW